MRGIGFRGSGPKGDRVQRFRPEGGRVLNSKGDRVQRFGLRAQGSGGFGFWGLGLWAES